VPPLRSAVSGTELLPDVNEFCYMRSMTTADRSSSREISRRIGMNKDALTDQEKNIMSDRNRINRTLKTQLIKTSMECT